MFGEHSYAKFKSEPLLLILPPIHYLMHVLKHFLDGGKNIIGARLVEWTHILCFLNWYLLLTLCKNNRRRTKVPIFKKFRLSNLRDKTLCILKEQFTMPPKLYETKFLIKFPQWNFHLLLPVNTSLHYILKWNFHHCQPSSWLWLLGHHIQNGYLVIPYWEWVKN